jgi:hypothetical protein
MRCTSWALSSRAAAAAFSGSRSTFRVPGMGTIQACLLNIQASEI